MTSMLAWKVPVHRMDCHRKALQRRSDSAGLTLTDVLAKPEAAARHASEQAFYNGNLNLSLALELELARRSQERGHFEASCNHLLNAAVSAAGSSQESVIRPAFAALNPDQAVNRASRVVRARWAMAFGNLERNFYNLGGAAAQYRSAATHLDSLPTSARDLYRPAYLRRVVSLKPSVSAARKAVDSARDGRDPYGQRTANAIEGWSNLAAGLVSPARQCFERVLWESKSPLSWWHAAETHFGLGLCYIIGGENVRTGIGHCLRSQYIRGVLALTGDVVVGVTLGRSSLEKGLGPGEVIATIERSDRRAFGPGSMTVLRSKWLDVDLQQKLFQELQADVGLYAV